MEIHTHPPSDKQNESSTKARVFEGPGRLHKGLTLLLRKFNSERRNCRKYRACREMMQCRLPAQTQRFCTSRKTNFKALHLGRPKSWRKGGIYTYWIAPCPIGICIAPSPMQSYTCAFFMPVRLTAPEILLVWPPCAPEHKSLAQRQKRAPRQSKAGAQQRDLQRTTCRMNVDDHYIVHLEIMDNIFENNSANSIGNPNSTAKRFLPRTERVRPQRRID